MTILHFLLSQKGIGKSLSLRISTSLGVSPTTLIKDLPPHKLDLLNSFLLSPTSIKPNLVINNSLTELVKHNIFFKIKNKTFQGNRLAQGLPVKGQRTRSNASTAKKFKYS